MLSSANESKLDAVYIKCANIRLLVSFFLLGNFMTLSAKQQAKGDLFGWINIISGSALSVFTQPQSRLILLTFQIMVTLRDIMSYPVNLFVLDMNTNKIFIFISLCAV